MDFPHPKLPSMKASMAVATFLFAFKVQAADGLYFSHHDWEIACDSKRTCRAAGYHSDNAERKVSVLLTRTAGPGSEVRGEFMLGAYGDEDQAFIATLPKNLKLTLRVNGRSYGLISISTDTLTGELPPSQLAALIAHLPNKAEITWSNSKNTWQLSDQGAAAVLLKMDEFQGRLGTPGALIRKGKRSEDSVPQPPVIPVVKYPSPLPTRPADAKVAKHPALRPALLATLKDDDFCTDLQENENPEIRIERLSENKLLASVQCWQAAYNTGRGYWIINTRPPFQPQLVTTAASEYSDGSISAAQKGRGLGDCWSTDAWTWNGQTFIHTESTSTGMCKLMGAGGAWALPRL